MTRFIRQTIWLMNSGQTPIDTEAKVLDTTKTVVVVPVIRIVVVVVGGTAIIRIVVPRAATQNGLFLPSLIPYFLSQNRAYFAI